ncbi:Hypothetical predicted protein [Podarcis lilfordi]|uniref:Uncharacterized protein n=1 Tax=Podarcis lilfordi TaxID=74358 RepID=A0AA35LNY7_9SAUR|nr:Hypothetical predicted protein [Podarcis lilfordi]
MPCNPQAIAQFFSAIETFYLQCRPVAANTSTPVAASQNCIPDTLPSEQVCAGPSTSAPSAMQPGGGSGNRPQTRSQSSRAQKSKSGATKTSVLGASAKSTRPVRPTSNQQVIDIPSIFQETPSQPMPLEGASGSSSEEVLLQQSTPTSTDPAPEVSGTQGGKRKAKRKHVARKSKRSEPSDSEDETGTSSSEYDSDAPMESYWGEGENIAGIPLWVHERRANSHQKNL